MEFGGLGGGSNSFVILVRLLSSLTLSFLDCQNVKAPHTLFKGNIKTVSVIKRLAWHHALELLSQHLFPSLPLTSCQRTLSMTPQLGETFLSCQKSSLKTTGVSSLFKGRLTGAHNQGLFTLCVELGPQPSLYPYWSVYHVPDCSKPLDPSVNKTEMGCHPYSAHIPNLQRTVSGCLLNCGVLSTGSYSPGSISRTALAHSEFEGN